MTRDECRGGSRADRASPEIKLVYLVPNFQNPSGTTLTLERRRRLLEAAGRPAFEYWRTILTVSCDIAVKHCLRSSDGRFGSGYLPEHVLQNNGSRNAARWVIAEPGTYQQLVIAKQATDSTQYVAQGQRTAIFARTRRMITFQGSGRLRRALHGHARFALELISERCAGLPEEECSLVELPEDVNAEELLAKRSGRRSLSFREPLLADQQRHISCA